MNVNNLFQKKYMQYFAIFSASLCMCALGAHTNWPSPSLLVLQSSKSPLRRPITDEEGSWLVSLLLLASLPGCLLGGFLCEKIGRKKTLLLGGLALLIPWFLIIFGTVINVLYIARIIAGLGQGILLLVSVKTFHQLSGQMAIESYIQTIISVSQSSISPENSSIIFGVIQIPAVLMTSILCDKIGRKALISISLTGCAISLFGEGTYFYAQDVLAGDVTSIAWLPTTGLAVYMLMCPIGVSTVPYVLMCELFPSNVKEIGVTMITLYGATLAFTVSKTFRPLSTIWGISTLFWIFSRICFVGVLFIITILPETKGKSVLEIQDKLKRDRKRINNETKT